RDLGVVPVIDADDRDAVFLSADLPAALFVDHLRRRLGAVAVDETPRSGGPAHHAEHADFEDPLLRRGGNAGGQRDRAGQHPPRESPYRLAPPAPPPSPFLHPRSRPGCVHARVRSTSTGLSVLGSPIPSAP